MTSKEVLKVIVRKHCVSNTDKEDKELEDCYKQVKADLNVLEILKKHLKVETDYCGDSEFKTHTTISLYWDNQKLSVDSKEGKEHKLVKEWLENE